MITHKVPIDFGPYRSKGGDRGGAENLKNFSKYVKLDNFDSSIKDRTFIRYRRLDMITHKVPIDFGPYRSKGGNRGG